MTPDEYLKLDVEVKEDNLTDSVCNLIERVNPDWMKRILAGDEEIEIKSLNGGISNQLYACYSKRKGIDSPETILIRVYGRNTELFVDRKEEIAAMRVVYSLGLGSKFYASFVNGMCYEYLSGDTVDYELATDPKVYPKIAEAMATLHLAGFKGLRTQDHLEPGEDLYLFREIEQLLSLINEDYAKSMPMMNEFYLIKTPSLKLLKEEFAQLKATIKQYTRAHKSLIVFSHNDLLLGNIVYNRSTESIKFIDFEYAGLNYQAYDIANHFNEFAGVDEPDYSRVPSRQFQLDWLRVYLNSFYSKISRFYVRQQVSDVDNDNEIVALLKEPDQAALEKFCDQVALCSLLSDFMWAVWSLVQAQNSTLSFNFLSFANGKFDEYFKNKSIFMPTKSSS